MLIVLMVPFLAIPQLALASHSAGICSTEAGRILAEETEATGVAAGFAGVITLIKNLFSTTNVPAQSTADVPGQTLQQGVTQQSTVSSKLSTISARLRDTCFKAVAVDLAQFVINAARDQVLNWINTGNFGDKPTFVTNFQFDAKQTAENAARLFASNLTGINFCNYFPQNPGKLNFRLDLKLGLACNFQKSRQDYLAGLANPAILTFDEKVLLFSSENDPVLQRLKIEERASQDVSQATEARKTQVTSGKGFIGIEKCVETKVVEEGYYIDEATGQRCQVDESGPPPGCDYVPPVTACAKTEQQTPGAFAADLATEPLKSEFRQNEVVTSLEQAIATIVNAAIGKVINGGLNKAFGHQ